MRCCRERIAQHNACENGIARFANAHRRREIAADRLVHEMKSVAASPIAPAPERVKMPAFSCASFALAVPKSIAFQGTGTRSAARESEEINAEKQKIPQVKSAP